MVLVLLKLKTLPTMIGCRELPSRGPASNVTTSFSMLSLLVLVTIISDFCTLQYQMTGLWSIAKQC